jgi:hypothetical protein
MKYIKHFVAILLIIIIFISCKKNNDSNTPVITLTGATKVYVEKGSQYVDLGATAYDNEDGDITQDIEITNNVNTSIVGLYSVTYNVEDKAGNKALEVKRNVEVMIFKK